MLHSDRLFSTDPSKKAIARRLYNEVRSLPLICPHGHTDPAWFSDNNHFTDPTTLLILPDHYVRRMLVSQGIQVLEILDTNGQLDLRAIWNIFAKHYYIFRGTPTQLWLNDTFSTLFGLTEPLCESNSEIYYEHISDCIAQDNCRPRAIVERFNIELITTTEGPCETLSHHQKIKQSEWDKRVISSYRPDSVIDPDTENFLTNVEVFGQCSGEDTTTWSGYLNAHRNRRAFFASMGATSTDHGHPTAQTLDLGYTDAQILFEKILRGSTTESDREMFRAQMLTEMAKMSIDDGLVMQLHAGSYRNHNPSVFEKFGTDQGFDIPRPTDYITALKPLLDKLGMSMELSLIIFTLDETSYGRELAPLAGAYPTIKLGPAWWFFDSPAGMLRYREMVTETAGFYNTVGFNDDTRALPSIAARHDVARRVDCVFLADKVARHIMSEDDALEVAIELAYSLAKKAYKL